MPAIARMRLAACAVSHGRGTRGDSLASPAPDLGLGSGTGLGVVSAERRSTTASAERSGRGVRSVRSKVADALPSSSKSLSRIVAA